MSLPALEHAKRSVYGGVKVTPSSKRVSYVPESHTSGDGGSESFVVPPAVQVDSPDGICIQSPVSSDTSTPTSRRKVRKWVHPALSPISPLTPPSVTGSPWPVPLIPPRKQSWMHLVTDSLATLMISPEGTPSTGAIKPHDVDIATFQCVSLDHSDTAPRASNTDVLPSIRVSTSSRGSLQGVEVNLQTPHSPIVTHNGPEARHSRSGSVHTSEHSVSILQDGHTALHVRGSSHGSVLDSGKTPRDSVRSTAYPLSPHHADGRLSNNITPSRLSVGEHSGSRNVVLPSLSHSNKGLEPLREVVDSPRLRLPSDTLSHVNVDCVTAVLHEDNSSRVPVDAEYEDTNRSPPLPMQQEVMVVVTNTPRNPSPLPEARNSVPSIRVTDSTSSRNLQSHTPIPTTPRHSVPVVIDQASDVKRPSVQSTTRARTSTPTPTSRPSLHPDIVVTSSSSSPTHDALMGITMERTPSTATGASRTSVSVLTKTRGSSGLGHSNSSRDLGSDIVIDPPSAGNNKEFAIHVACWNGSYSAVEALLDNEASPVDPDTKKRTPMHYAACAGEVSVLELLCAAGAELSVDDQDCEGFAPLHLAAWKGHMLCALFLMDSLANPVLRDKRRRTPADVAAMGGHKELAAMITYRSSTWRKISESPSLSTTPEPNEFGLVPSKLEVVQIQPEVVPAPSVQPPTSGGRTTTTVPTPAPDSPTTRSRSSTNAVKRFIRNLKYKWRHKVWSMRYNLNGLTATEEEEPQPEDSASKSSSEPEVTSQRKQSGWRLFKWGSSPSDYEVGNIDRKSSSRDSPHNRRVRVVETKPERKASRPKSSDESDSDSDNGSGSEDDADGTPEPLSAKDVQMYKDIIRVKKLMDGEASENSYGSGVKDGKSTNGKQTSTSRLPPRREVPFTPGDSLMDVGDVGDGSSLHDDSTILELNGGTRALHPHAFMQPHPAAYGMNPYMMMPMGSPMFPPHMSPLMSPYMPPSHGHVLFPPGSMPSPFGQPMFPPAGMGMGMGTPPMWSVPYPPLTLPHSPSYPVQSPQPVSQRHRNPSSNSLNHVAIVQ